ncbi:MAG TPA: hypothetical protein VJQ82_05240 [Terriglobales bacterium]|nr:hypothetical protein [Terriglobales bacterium]
MDLNDKKTRVNRPCEIYTEATLVNRALVTAATLLLSIANIRGEAGLVPPQRVLTVTETQKMDIPFFATFGQAKADERGNIYFHAATRNYNDATIIGISPRSSRPLIFTLPEEFAEKMNFETFFVAPSGTVYVLAETADRIRIIFEFDSDGNVSQHTKIAIPRNVGVDAAASFEDGNFVVLGHYDVGASRNLKALPFLGFFDSSGRLIRKLSRTGIPKNNYLGDTASTTRIGEVWISTGDDGNLYLLVSDQILIMNESGGIIRRIKFRKPDGGAAAVKVAVSGGMAAVWFEDESGPGHTVRLRLETIDVGNGKPIVLYFPSEELGNTAVSFSRKEGFVFVQPIDNKVALLTAQLQ